MISVIIPTYNCAEYLVRSVSCALHQTFSDIEVIVVDDGSTDNSQPILAELAAADARLKVVTTPNRGVAAARNTGLNHASGEYLFFLDADDAIHEDALKTLHGIIETTGADVALGGHVKLPEKKAPGFSSSLSVIASEVQLFDSQSLVRDILYQTSDADHSPWGKLYRRKLFDGLRFPEGKIYEDLLIIPQVLLRASSIALLPAPIYCYTVREKSLIHTVDIRKGDALEITRLLIPLMAEKSPELARAAADRHLSACFNILKIIPLRSLKSGIESERKLYNQLLRQAREGVRRFRKDSLRDAHVRVKNRLAALISYLLF